jgi:hypothetical protein
MALSEIKTGRWFFFWLIFDPPINKSHYEWEVGKDELTAANFVAAQTASRPSILSAIS